ncbi:hypothetical protein LCGC14_0276100 [marine sediment metagenome]|uniref:AP2/ERF domain-containing protein n=1 Tax=marine sediment metagenome TaxID=412755 RepID=A0A0F9X2W7_9ZZZZ
MKEILLTQGYVALVDDEDYEWLSQWKWYSHRGSSSGPWAERNSPPDDNGKRSPVLMHRQIMDAPSDRDVDHHDHCMLNNQRANLRVCTTAQNMANRRKSRGCSSRFKGVCWDKEHKKWRVRIGVNGCSRHLGYCDDEMKAALVYNKEAIKEWGEFSLPNNV